MKLLGNKLCTFLDATEMLLLDNKLHYEVIHDDAKMYYPILETDELRCCGFLAIAEYIMNFTSGMRLFELSEAVRDRYYNDLAKKDANRRMWLYMILNEIWYGAAQLIIDQRVVHRLTNHQSIRDAREKLAMNLVDIDRWIEENIYVVDINCYTDTLLAAIIATLDYLEEITWSKFPNLKGWYLAFKSKPASRKLMAKNIPGHRMPKWYTSLDY